MYFLRTTLLLKLFFKSSILAVNIVFVVYLYSCIYGFGMCTMCIMRRPGSYLASTRCSVSSSTRAISIIGGHRVGEADVHLIKSLRSGHLARFIYESACVCWSCSSVRATKRDFVVCNEGRSHRGKRHEKAAISMRKIL